MKVKDALAETTMQPPYRVVYRLVFPSTKTLSNYYTVFAGCCNWDGEKLTSLDNDSYSLDDEIEYFTIEENENSLTVYY